MVAMRRNDMGPVTNVSLHGYVAVRDAACRMTKVVSKLDRCDSERDSGSIGRWKAQGLCIG